MSSQHNLYDNQLTFTRDPLISFLFSHFALATRFALAIAIWFMVPISSLLNTSIPMSSSVTDTRMTSTQIHPASKTRSHPATSDAFAAEWLRKSQEDIDARLDVSSTVLVCVNIVHENKARCWVLFQKKLRRQHRLLHTSDTWNIYIASSSLHHLLYLLTFELLPHHLFENKLTTRFQTALKRKEADHKAKAKKKELRR